MAFRVQIRRDPSGKWIVNNPVLLSGEFGYETDTSYMKIGDGATPWNYLPYWTGADGATGATGGVILPYRVYTALLTQSGGDDLLETDNIPLIIGVTYMIRQNTALRGDFTNVGAPNNNDGTYFVATGTTPNEWGQDSVFYNTGAPVAIVLENTIGNIWFTYNTQNGQGFYKINSDGLFINGKTYSTLGVVTDTDYARSYNGNLWVTSNNLLEISTIDTSELEPIDGLLNNTTIEIKVYN
jgi:hypothetical protein